MKNLFIIIIIVSATFAKAQIKAITEVGDEVILYTDGTWKYSDNSNVLNSEIKVNPTIFKKPSSSTFLLKSKAVDMGFWLNPKIWSFSKPTNNDDAEYELELKEGDLYGMIITEKVEIPLESLKNIAYENAKALVPDIRIINEEYRTVNGLKVLLLQMNGTMQGIKFSYYGYYYSNEGGTLQFITYTSQNLLDDYKSTCDDLLNGIVVVE